MVNRERDDNIYYARLAEQGERYEDMIKYMKEVAMVSKAMKTVNPIDIIKASEKDLKCVCPQSVTLSLASNLK